MPDNVGNVAKGTALPEGFEAGLQPNLVPIQEQQDIITQQIESQTANFETLQANVDASVVDTRATLKNYETAVLQGLQDTTTATEDIVAPFQAQLEGQLTNIRNAYDLQINQQAKQIDALVGQGAFGGNAFRAQQAYASTMQQLTAQSLGQIGQFTLQAEQTILDA